MSSPLIAILSAIIARNIKNTNHDGRQAASRRLAARGPEAYNAGIDYPSPRPTKPLTL